MLSTLYRQLAPGYSLWLEASAAIADMGQIVAGEYCFYIEHNGSLSGSDKAILNEILCGKEGSDFTSLTHLQDRDGTLCVEVGPRLSFSTPWCSNTIAILHSLQLFHIIRVERTRRWALSDAKDSVVSSLYDMMTEQVYKGSLTTLSCDSQELQQHTVINVIEDGIVALEKANTEFGLGFDSQDMVYYAKIFKDRNPTNVELFDLAQSNSEHSRHWFFKGRLVVDGTEDPQSLFDIVIDTQIQSNKNSVIAFSDNSSAIEGCSVSMLSAQCPYKASPLSYHTVLRHPTLTAETHNFPTGVSPFQGATTGTGGRLRDGQSTGKGSHVIAGSAGYCFGNLNIPGASRGYEDPMFSYPSNFASPLSIAIEASNGASDYGNKFGEPVITGFVRSFGEVVGGERREWVKPIMFSGGIGAIEGHLIKKDKPAPGMKLVKIGGPAYRIGVGGGAASSIEVQGTQDQSIDYNAVQRGDPEMGQKLNRVVRGCCELLDNPIQSIHDQGAGGNGNVLKELCEPTGGIVHCSKFSVGDNTLSALELWGAEYQESNALLTWDPDVISKIGSRESCYVDVVGEIVASGRVKLVDDRTSNVTVPLDLDLNDVLGKVPRKVFELAHVPLTLTPLPPSTCDIYSALKEVFSLPAVGSKRWLTNKVDRSVTGLIAQQQCVGPAHTPLSNVAVTALSYTDTVGIATAIGEQPIKGLVDVSAGARMSVGEALTNLMWAPVTALRDVKCSANWMWAAKLAGEGALLYDACKAMCTLMKELGVAVDGGKDSLSMAAKVGSDTVKAPGELVISVYALCTDINNIVTPDLKMPGQGVLCYVRCDDVRTLGGTAFSQVQRNIGDEASDVRSGKLLAALFNTTQSLIKSGYIKSGHDISDGGLITCVLEMCFSGLCTADVDLHSSEDTATLLFSEGLGIVIEVEPQYVARVEQLYLSAGLLINVIGTTGGLVNEGSTDNVTVRHNGAVVLDQSWQTLLSHWEHVSDSLEALQSNPETACSEQSALLLRQRPQWNIAFDNTPLPLLPRTKRVGIVREQGSNGDREMAAAFYQAGFEVWDVNMMDICKGEITLDSFRGIAFVGGFSFADVNGSAVGWSSVVKYNETAKAQFSAFYNRTDVFSLGVCNGCQLMAQLGWLGHTAGSIKLSHNKSRRFESRFSSMLIPDNKAMMLQGMAHSVLGIWVAHGEGQFLLSDAETLHSQGTVALQYTDDSGAPTEVYPHNPNGSTEGVAGLCSPCGRHLAIMPHPERVTRSWQWPWRPEGLFEGASAPWARMFSNARKWCEE